MREGSEMRITDAAESFAQIRPDWLDLVEKNIHIISEHTFAGTEVGEVLADAIGTRGKMIRPRLLLISGSFGPLFEERKDRLCMLAAMVELTHLASLIHDDIVDEAPMRRGVASIQGKYGKDAAVFAGDFLMSRINTFAFKNGLNESGETLTRTIEQMCIGEIGQARWRYREDVSKEQYLQNIQGKTTALFRSSCQIGAYESGCSDEVAGRLKSIGEYLGILFQLRDDLLDFTADTHSVGKETHKDFRDGIYTMPVLMAMCDEAGRRELAPIIRKNRETVLGDSELQEMEEIVIARGGVERTKAEIRRYHQKIYELLDNFNGQESAALLGALVRKLEV